MAWVKLLIPTGAPRGEEVTLWGFSAITPPLRWGLSRIIRATGLKRVSSLGAERTLQLRGVGTEWVLVMCWE